MTHPDLTPAADTAPATAASAAPAIEAVPSEVTPTGTLAQEKVNSELTVPVAAQPTKENVSLLVRLMLGLTTLLMLFDGILIVLRPDLDPMLLTKITMALVFAVNTVVLSLFTIGKGSTRRLYKLRKAISVLADPDSPEGRS